MAASVTDKQIPSAISQAKAAGRPIKRFHDHGMYLLCKPSGAALWRFKYRVAGRSKEISLGSYPEVSLKNARDRRLEVRRMVSDGIDPSEVRKAAKRGGASTFEKLAEEYLGNQAERLAVRTMEKLRWQLREFVNPILGRRPVADIKPQELLAVLRRIEARGKTETAHKTKELVGRIFAYAISTGVAERNIAADLKGALKPRVVRNYPAITDPAKVGELLRAIDSFAGQPATSGALRLAPHVFLRPGELRQGKWKEIDFDSAQWRIPGSRMKMKREHIVPLSRQSIEILKILEPITGDGEWIFPAIGGRGRPISENTLGCALRAIGYPSDVHVPHSFRAMASTLLHERGEISSDIELQLAHADRNKIRAVYNRAERLAERRLLMQRWSDYLDSLQAGGNVVQFKRPA